MSLHQNYQNSKLISVKTPEKREEATTKLIANPTLKCTPSEDYTGLTTLELLKEFNLLLTSITKNELTSTKAIFRLSHFCFTILMRLDRLELKELKELKEEKRVENLNYEI